MNKETKKFYELKAEIIQAAAHPIRLAVIEFLSKGEQCVCDIVEHVGAQRSNVSRHLSMMVRAGVLQHHKEGLKVIYKLKTPCILDFFSCITTCLKQQVKDSEKLLDVL